MANNGENSLYTVEVCGLTGVECIHCVGECDKARLERRETPWQGNPRVDSHDVQRVPSPDKSGKGRNNYDMGLRPHSGKGHGPGDWWERAYGD